MEKGMEVRVVCRCRPQSLKEKHLKDRIVTNLNLTTNEVEVVNASKGNKKQFAFNKVFGPESTQLQVYKDVVSPIVKEVIKGFNCTVFAYGQTGTGKTFTMEGLSGNEAKSGMIPRAVKELFSILEASGKDYSVTVSYLELYNEELRDLFALTRKPLKIVEDNRHGVKVLNLEEVTVLNAENIFSILEQSASKRITASTALNSQSSRSHCIFTITVRVKEVTPEGEDLVTTGKLNLVDLAGSENMSRAGTGGDLSRRKEGQAINQSLLTLGRVINYLSDKAPHIPYRESKLTRLLQDSLGGRAKTSMIVTIGPCLSAIDETLGTLEYGCKAKNIKNLPEINQSLSHKLIIKDMNSEIEDLKLQLQAARSKEGVYLPNGIYNEMQDKLAQSTTKINELEEQLELKKQEKEKWEGLFKRKKAEHEKEQQLRQQREAELESTKGELKETQEFLDKTKSELGAHQRAIENKDQTEDELRKHATDLIAKLKQSLARQELLQVKIQKLSQIIEDNNNKTRLFKSYSAEQMGLVKTESKKFTEGQAAQLQTVCNVASGAKDAYEELLRGIDAACDKGDGKMRGELGTLIKSTEESASQSIAAVDAYESSLAAQLSEEDALMTQLSTSAKDAKDALGAQVEVCNSSLKQWLEEGNAAAASVQTICSEFAEARASEEAATQEECENRLYGVMEESVRVSDGFASAADVRAQLKANTEKIAALVAENQRLTGVLDEKLGEVQKATEEALDHAKTFANTVATTSQARVESAKQFAERAKKQGEQGDDTALGCFTVALGELQKAHDAAAAVLGDTVLRAEKQQGFIDISRVEGKKLRETSAGLASASSARTTEVLGRVLDAQEATHNAVKSLALHDASAALQGGGDDIDSLAVTINDIGAKESEFAARVERMHSQYTGDLDTIMAAMKQYTPTGDTPAKQTVDFITPSRLPYSKRVADFREESDSSEEPSKKRLSYSK